MKTVWKILILILIVSNNTYGSGRGNTEPVKKTSNNEDLEPVYGELGDMNSEIWEDTAANSAIDFDVEIPFYVSFPNLDAEYTMKDIVVMTLEQKVNFAIVFLILSNSYVSKEDMDMLYELLPRNIKEE